MKEEFSGEFTVVRDGEEFEYEESCINSTVPNLYDMIDTQYDLLQYLEEREDFKNMKEGFWHHVYVRGTLDYETSTDWESGLTEGEWIFNDEFIKIIELYEDKSAPAVNDEDMIDVSKEGIFIKNEPKDIQW